MGGQCFGMAEVAKRYYIGELNFSGSVNRMYQGLSYTTEEYNNAKLEALENAKEKVTYTIEFNVTKDQDGNWKLTSLDNEKRHQPIELVKKYEGNEDAYPFYDNYYGINVNKTQDIPADYMGAMGVPITFLNKYDPEQFEIIKFRKGDDDKDLRVNGKAPYFRILIKRKTA